jgi:hypothetical protein
MSYTLYTLTSYPVSELENFSTWYLLQTVYKLQWQVSVHEWLNVQDSVHVQSKYKTRHNAHQRVLW